MVIKDLKVGIFFFFLSLFCGFVFSLGMNFECCSLSIAIHGDADTFNPVDKVRSHVELAKEMGYKVSFYQDLPLTKWLKEKEKADDSSKIRFENRNRERYRKKSPLEYEKY